MSAPSLRNIMQTSQREFATAKVLQFFDMCKKKSLLSAIFLVLG